MAENLDVKKKADGKVDGLYFCKKQKQYINPSNTECEKFEKAFKRQNWESNEIYEAGKKYYNDSTPVGIYVFILIFMKGIIFFLTTKK